MTIHNTFLEQRKTLSEFCDLRENAVKLLIEHFNHFDMIEAECNKIGKYATPRYARPTGTLKEAIKELDQSVWRAAFILTGMMQILDAASKRKFDQSLHDDPPAFTLGNVQSAFLEFAQTADKMFDDGIINVFGGLNGKYKTHDQFSVGEKIIMGFVIDPRFSRGLRVMNGSGQDRLNDIDRVFKVLDGKPHVAYSLTTAMDAAFQEAKDYEDEYFSMRAFKNKNLHLRFKRGDLVDKVNKIIAKRYGNTVGQR